MKLRTIFSVWVALLLLAPTLCMAQEERAANEEIFLNPESLVRGLYAAVSIDPGNTHDWDYVRKFFIPEVVFAVRMTRTSMAVLNLDEFVEWFKGDVKKYKMLERGFEEIVQKMKMTVFGDMAQCFVVYKARLKTQTDAPGTLGLDSFGLMKKDGRWWVVSITNDIVTSQNLLPEELR
jgi:hypothetical protein